MSLPFAFMHTTFPEKLNIRIHHGLLIADDYTTQNDIMYIHFYLPNRHKDIILYAIFKIIDYYIVSLTSNDVWFWVDKYFFDDNVTEELSLTIQYRRYVFFELNFPFEFQRALYYGYRNSARIHLILNKFPYSTDDVFGIMQDD